MGLKMFCEKLHKRECLIHICAILFICLLCCLNIGRLDHISIINDEFGYWSTAVSIAGYDWKELIAVTPYYAWGYSIWLIPIVVFLPTPELWYKAAILLNVLFLCCSYFLCYFSGKRLFRDENKILVGLVSFVTVIYPSNIVHAQLTWVENLKYFLVWVITYLIIRLEEKFSFKKCIFLIIVVVYSYAVHGSNIGLMFAAIVCLGVILWRNGKGIWYLLIFVGLMAVGYKGCELIKEYQVGMVYGNSSSSNLNNISVNAATTISYIQRITGQMKMFITSLGGKYIYLLIGSGLTLPIAIIQVLKDTVEDITKKSLFKDYNISRCWCVFVLGVMWGLCALQMNTWTIRKDVIVYGRYMESAIGPVLFLGIMYAIIRVREARLGMIIAVISCLAGIFPVYYFVSAADGGFSGPCSPVIGAFFQLVSDGDVKKVFLYLTVAVSALAVVLLLSTMIKSKWKRAGLVLIILGIFFGVLGYQASLYEVKDKEFFDSMTVPLRDKLSGEHEERTIYFVRNNDIDRYCMNPKYFQFLIPERTIHVITVDELKKIADKEAVVMVYSYDDEAKDAVVNGCEGKKIDSSWLGNVYLID